MSYKNKEDQLKCQRDWYKRNSQKQKEAVSTRKKSLLEWFNEYKRSVSCSTCSESHEACIDFHHTDPSTKDINISTAVANGWSLDRIKNEIEKCIPLCANCHRKFHFNERQ